MKTDELTLSQVRDRGYAALLKELGPVDFARFVQQTEPGEGDYTRDRAAAIGGLSVDEVQRIIAQQRLRKP